MSARLAVLISGGGRTLLNLLDRIEAGELDAEVTLVIASRECPGAERARRRGLPVFVQHGELERESFGALLREHGIDWVVLGGYLKLAPIPEGYDGRMVNIHPALLPSFGGPGMYGGRVHEAVLNAGSRVSGCTVHLCDDRYDQGPIILQRACEVREDDTPETLAARVFELECEALPNALALLLSGRVQVVDGRVRIDPVRERA